MRLEHVAVFARNSTALAEWYCRVFDMRVALAAPVNPPAYFVADRQGFCIEIIGTAEPPAIGETGRVFHVAFVVDDFDAAVRQLLERGVPLEPETGKDGLRVRFFHDPEGNRLQIIRRPAPLA